MLRDQGLPIVLQGSDALPPVTDIGVHVEEMIWRVPSLSHKILNSCHAIVRCKEASTKDFNLSYLHSSSSSALSCRESLTISRRYMISFVISS
jgi:hypothetical protein